MTTQEFAIPRVGWSVIALYDVSHKDYSAVVSALCLAGCDCDMAVRSADKLCDGENNGLTYSNERNRQSVVAIGVTTDAEEFANTYDHEKGHLVRHISQFVGFPPHGEEEQYVAGYVGQQMFRAAKHYLCDCCREKSQSFFRVFGV